MGSILLLRARLEEGDVLQGAEITLDEDSLPAARALPNQNRYIPVKKEFDVCISKYIH